jgi:hypothetical protein
MNEVERHIVSAMFEGRRDPDDGMECQRPEGLEMNDQGDTVATVWTRGLY